MDKANRPEDGSQSLAQRIQEIFLKFNLLRRSYRWKEHVNTELQTLQLDVLELQRTNNRLADELRTRREAFLDAFRGNSDWHSLFSPKERVFCARRGDTLQFVRVEDDVQKPFGLGGLSGEAIIGEITSGHIRQVVFRHLGAEGQLGPPEIQPRLLEFVKLHPKASVLLFDAMSLGDGYGYVGKAQSDIDDATQMFFSEAMAALTHEPNLVDFLALGQAAYLPTYAGTKTGIPLPFDDAGTLPRLEPAKPKKRSVVFLHNNYYHFNTLADALRRRGWEATTVSVESPDSPQRQFYFGEDINLYHDDPEIRHRQVREFIQKVPERFGALHFCGQGQPSFFPENFDNTENRTRVPWDFLELRRHQTIIGYTASGCQDGASQSAISRISGDVCARCIWQLRPDVCGDDKNKAWAHTLDSVCDWVSIEGDWAVEDRVGPKFIRGPITSTLDPDYWSLEIEVPEEMIVEREPGEILVYHAVGNLETRRDNGRDIKGSSAVEAAIARLRAEGIPIRLYFASKLPITEVRYYKAQADIVVDQLNYGRIGANARESLMLGIPLITRLMPEQGGDLPPLRHVAECPALDATEETIESVLKGLAMDTEKRKSMSSQSRDFALKWYSGDVCARRFETVIDRVAKGLPAETEDLYQ